MQDLRCRRRRLRARRRMWNRGLKASERCRGGRRPHLGRHSRLRSEPRWSEYRPNGAKRSGAAAGDRGRTSQGRGSSRPSGLCGGTWHWNSSRGPHRVEGAGGGLQPRPLYRTTASDWLREDELRPPRTGGRRRCGDESPLVDEQGNHPEALEFLRSDSDGRLG